MNIALNSFIEKPKNTHFDGEDPDERILYVFRRSLVTNLDWIFVAILLIITPFIADSIYSYFRLHNQLIISPKFVFILNLFWYLFTFGYIFQNFLNWFFNVYIISNKKIIDVDFHGVLYKNISESPLKNIEDVTSNVSGALQVIFNYGNVYIQTAGERREFEFEDVSNPARIRDIISDLVMEKRYGT